MNDSADRIEELIYQNEVLTTEVEELRAELEAAGANNIQNLRSERDALRRELEVVSVRLEERTSQLEALTCSGNHLTNLDLSVQHLTDQMNEQQKLLEEMRESLVEKESIIARLKENIKIMETKVNRKVVSPEMEDAQVEVAALRSQLVEAEEKYAEEREASRSAKESLQLQLDQLLNDHDALIHDNANLRRAARDNAIARRACDLTSDEVRQHVEEKVTEAVENYSKEVERLQKENEALLKKLSVDASTSGSGSTGGTTHSPVQRRTGPSHIDPADPMSPHRRSIDSLHTEMNRLLSLGNCTPEEIRQVVQRLLDTQEQAFEEMQNQMLIKDIQLQDKENVFRVHMKRLERENESLRTAIAVERDDAAAERRRQQDRLKEATTEPAPSRENSPQECMINCPRCTLEQKRVPKGKCSLCGFSFEEMC